MAKTREAEAPTVKAWQSKITGHGKERVEDLLANPFNWRVHGAFQQRSLAGAIDSVGFIRSVTVNKLSGHIVDGHLRVTLALRSGVDEIDCEYVELTEAEEKEALLELDPIAALAGTDKDKVDDLLREINSDDERVQELLAEIAKDAGLDYGAPPADDPGAQVDKAEELRAKWGVELGDLWQLGEHRLICGDCTDRAVVERVMGGERADMGFTSPPYNQGGKAKRLPAFYGGKNDNKTKDEYYSMLINCLLSISTVCDSDTPMLWNVMYNSNSRDDYGKIVFGDDNPFHVMETIVWDKLHGFNVSARGILSRDSEIIFLMCLGEDYFTNQGRYETWYNTWRIGTMGSQTKGHGAAFPVELAEKAINSFCKESGGVIDPFLGSGTTLIACERLGRKCRAIEISPAYCAVAIERWAQMTGGIPRKIELSD